MLPNQASGSLRNLLQWSTRIYANRCPSFSVTSRYFSKFTFTNSNLSSSKPFLSVHASSKIYVECPALSNSNQSYLTLPNTHSEIRGASNFSTSCVVCDVASEHTAEKNEEEKAPQFEYQRIANSVWSASFEQLMKKAPSVATGNHGLLILQRLSVLHKEGLTDCENAESMLQDDRLSRVLQVIDKKLKRLNSKLLLDTLAALYDMTATDVYITQSLANQILWLLRRLPMAILIQVLQLHLSHQETPLRKHIAKETLANLERRWVELTNPKDVVFLMNTLTRGVIGSQKFAEKLEDRALDTVENATPKELYLTLHLLSCQSRRNTPLIRAAFYHLNKNSLSSLSTIQLSNLLYALCTLNAFEASLLGKISAELNAKREDLTPKLAASVVLSFSRLRWKESETLGVLLDLLEGNLAEAQAKTTSQETVTSGKKSRIDLTKLLDSEFKSDKDLTSNSLDSVKPDSSESSKPGNKDLSHETLDSSQKSNKDLTTDSLVSSKSNIKDPSKMSSALQSLDVSDKARLVLSLANLNSQTEQSKRLVEKIIKSPDVQALRSSGPLQWLDVVWSLSVLRMLDASTAASVLGEDFWGTLPGTDDFQSALNLIKVNNINAAARYEVEGYAGPFLPPTLTTADASPLQKGERKVTEKLMSALADIAPLNSYTCTEVTAPGGYFIDAEFYVDANGTPKLLSQVQPNSSDVHRVALKVLNFPDLTLPTSDPTGLHVMAARHLHCQGYTVVEVKHKDINKNAKVVELVKLLQEKVKDAIKVKDS